MTAGACVLPLTMRGMTEASATRRPLNPCTLKPASTTDVAGSTPMAQLLVDASRSEWYRGETRRSPQASSPHRPETIPGRSAPMAGGVAKNCRMNENISRAARLSASSCISPSRMHGAAKGSDERSVTLPRPRGRSCMAAAVN